MVLLKRAHKGLTLFVLIGWAIYPIGYMIGTGDGIFILSCKLLAIDMECCLQRIGDAINKIGIFG